jgi:hypothetical protein
MAHMFFLKCPIIKLEFLENENHQGSQVHVLNAPSPGATLSLVISICIIENYLASLY